MREKRIFLAFMAFCSSFCMYAQGAADFAKGLLNIDKYNNDAQFEVLLPSAMEPVVYDITLQSEACAPNDSLAPCNYVIRWSTETNGGPLEGFSAYYDGNHYRYRNNRLQEYHFESNPAPFMPLGPGSQTTNGVQCTAQFADMLPQFLGNKINEIISDTSYIYVFHPDTIVNKHRSIVVDGVKRASGYDQMQYEYVFDYETKLPVMSEITSSPGSISEQIVTITYGNGASVEPIAINEDSLISTWPEIFERFRESTFRAENLVNTPLPTFACQQLNGDERYAHHVNEGLTRPTIIAVLDPAVSTTSEVISGIRDAIAMSPMDVDIIWAFNSNQQQEIAEVTGRLLQGEIALVSANSLVRNCGITLFPTILIVDRTGNVTDVVSGYNNDTPLVVLQKAMILK